MKHGSTPRRIGGFTLIELLMVIAVVAILCTILIPVIGSIREKGIRAKATSNLRTIYSAFIQFSHENDGMICPGYDDSLSGYNAFFPLRLKDYVGQPQEQYDTLHSIFLSPHETKADFNGSYVMNYNCSKGNVIEMGISNNRAKYFYEFERPGLTGLLYDRGRGSGHGTGSNIVKRDGQAIFLFLDGSVHLRETVEPWGTGLWVGRPVVAQTP